MLETSVATPLEREIALRLLYSHLDEPERQQQIDMILQQNLSGEVSLEGLFLARQAGLAVGALMATVQADGTSLVFPPAVTAGSLRGEVEESLMRALTRWLDDKGVTLAQGLLEVAEIATRQLFERHGFRCLAELIYLKRDEGPISGESFRDPDFVTYSEATHDRFCRTLQRTYLDTRDCPELSRVRSAEQALAGHRLAGEYDPKKWFLYADREEDFAVLLLTQHPEALLWEVVYFGIVPEFRHRGWGAELMKKALNYAGKTGGGAMILAVDAVNDAARVLYAKLGFYECLRRSAHLRIRSAGEV